MTHGQIDGVYYESKKIEAGTMATKRTHDSSHDLHYYCKSNEKGEVDLFFLKPDGTRTTMVMENIEHDEFTSRFHDCSDHKCELKPRTEKEKQQELAETKVSVAENHLEKNELHAAAFEFGQAIKHDDKNLRAHLGKGKAHISLGEVDKAKESFEKMSQIDDLYDADNKHLFNEYGIELRRGELYKMAIENYRKAISIDPKDEVLYFNMARALSEKGETAEAIQNLEKAISLKPDFIEAKLLRKSIA